MELQKAIEILECYQEWRVGKIDDMIIEPKKLTNALDMVLSEVKKIRLGAVSGSLSIETKLKMFYEFLYERGIAKQLGVGIDTIVKHFIDEKLSGNDS